MSTLTRSLRVGDAGALHCLAITAGPVLRPITLLLGSGDVPVAALQSHLGPLFAQPFHPDMCLALNWTPTRTWNSITHELLDLAAPSPYQYVALDTALFGESTRETDLKDFINSRISLINTKSINNESAVSAAASIDSMTACASWNLSTHSNDTVSEASLRMPLIASSKSNASSNETCAPYVPEFYDLYTAWTPEQIAQWQASACKQAFKMRVITISSMYDIDPKVSNAHLKSIHQRWLRYLYTSVHDWSALERLLDLCKCRFVHDLQQFAVQFDIRRLLFEPAPKPHDGEPTLTDLVPDTQGNRVSIASLFERTARGTRSKQSSDTDTPSLNDWLDYMTEIQNCADAEVQYLQQKHAVTEFCMHTLAASRQRFETACVHALQQFESILTMTKSTANATWSNTLKCEDDTLQALAHTFQLQLDAWIAQLMVCMRFLAHHDRRVRALNAQLDRWIRVVRQCDALHLYRIYATEVERRVARARQWTAMFAEEVCVADEFAVKYAHVLPMPLNRALGTYNGALYKLDPRLTETAYPYMRTSTPTSAIPIGNTENARAKDVRASTAKSAANETLIAMLQQELQDKNVALAAAEARCQTLERKLAHVETEARTRESSYKQFIWTLKKEYTTIINDLKDKK